VFRLLYTVSAVVLFRVTGFRFTLKQAEGTVLGISWPCYLAIKFSKNKFSRDPMSGALSLLTEQIRSVWAQALHATVQYYHVFVKKITYLTFK
jgi:hypothetical protein